MKSKIILEIHDSSFEIFRNEYEDQLEILKNIVKQTNPYTLELDKFMINRANRKPSDYYQIVETNEFPMFFAYGVGAEIYSFQLQLRKDKLPSKDWYKTFNTFYETFRTSTIANYDLDFKIQYDGKLIKGIWFDTSFDQDSRTDDLVNLGFNFFVLERIRG